MAESPSTAATSRRCARYEASSIDRSSWNGKQNRRDYAGRDEHRGILTAMNDPREVRRAIRARRHTGHTAGLAPGHVQGNVCILPREYADEFRAFCERNPKPCPLLAMSRPGDPRLPALGEDLDIRTDVPRYRIFVDGALARGGR